MSHTTSIFGGISLAALALLTPSQAVGQWTPQATVALNFCLSHPDNCSISINHLTGGWQRDYHGTRLNVLASTFKLVPLIAYAEAVSNGQLNPQTAISRDQWVKFWTGQDGGALYNAWQRLGQPQTVTLDQMVGAMIIDSDNATPDYLLDKLGPASMQNVIERYFLEATALKAAHPRAGYFVDPPQSIAAMYTSWMGMPGYPLYGSSNEAGYSGIETFGYPLELSGLFAALHTPATVQAQRNFLCLSVPWQVAPSPCTFGSGITEPVHRAMTTGFFPKSNTRTYTRLMTGLLQRNLLPPQVQSIVEPHLEWWLTPTEGSTEGQLFRRYGAKPGSLGTGFAPCNQTRQQSCLTVATWTAYAETLQNAPGSNNHGVQVVVTIQLRDPVPGSNLLQETQDLLTGVRHFADALALDPVFANTVRAELPDDPLLPELITNIIGLGPDRAGPTTPTTVEIHNIGTAATTRSTTVNFYHSNTSSLAPGATPIFTATIPPIGPGASIRYSFFLYPGGNYLISVIDPQDLITEADRENNIRYEKLLALR